MRKGLQVLDHSNLGFSRGRKTTGEEVLGKEEKLGELIYKYELKE
jgi:hypothetical protein